MVTVFAGFWVNSSVRKPVAGVHTNNGFVVAKSSLESETYGMCSLKQLLDGWYWLDTTKRNELTPEEMFSLVKVTRPDVERIIKAVTPWQFITVGSSQPYITVNWGDTTEYPPQKKWIRVTKDNVAKYMFKPCRYDVDVQPGTVAGWNTKINCCLISNEGGMISANEFVVVEE